MFTPSQGVSGVIRGYPGKPELRRASGPDRSLTVSATNNRPHCLYRRPASRQARKPANDRENLVRLLDGETPEPSE